ncbi:unnamed protein product [Tilletia laevis]|uniref:Mediator complex subunit 11 n=2 Tax=Tilletia TaxID=13289 RepID=A0A177VIB2_9BASI|nr:hypothetical protein CF336_g5516 [Tilletia laevis]KAE8257080.1 hypothetical protein A4X03_0g4791 [Tilletia caries]CAD6975019.1 unnamed protein product [Tilletia controversa]KAE8196772.1 hypothetical protein CF335_g4772 [Tilletia laevis]CAD6884264.1 unnamed protein product [Tilletia caries]
MAPANQPQARAAFSGTPASSSPATGAATGPGTTATGLTPLIAATPTQPQQHAQAGSSIRGGPAAQPATSAQATPGSAVAAPGASSGALPDPSRGLNTFVQGTLPTLEHAGMQYFDRTERGDEAGSTTSGSIHEATQAFDAALSSALRLLGEYGLARMPLQPEPAPASSAELVEDVQVEFEKRERLREGASLVQSVLRQTQQHQHV